MFSCPMGRAGGGDDFDDGAWFPASGAALKARFRGLLGEARARASGRDDGDSVLHDLAERSDSLRLGRSGVKLLFAPLAVAAGGADCGCEGDKC